MNKWLLSLFIFIIPLLVWASIPPAKLLPYGDEPEKVINFQCIKKDNWTTLIHVNGSQDAIELKDVYCPYIKAD